MFWDSGIPSLSDYLQNVPLSGQYTAILIIQYNRYKVQICISFLNCRSSCMVDGNSYYQRLKEVAIFGELLILFKANSTIPTYSDATILPDIILLFH